MRRTVAALALAASLLLAPPVTAGDCPPGHIHTDRMCVHTDDHSNLVLAPGAAEAPHPTSGNIDTQGASWVRERPPVCAPEEEHRTVALFGHRGEVAPEDIAAIRREVGRLNNTVADSALDTSGGQITADLRVACTTDGDIYVGEFLDSGGDHPPGHHARAAGFDSPVEKYLIFLDRANDETGRSRAMWAVDDSLSPDNRNLSGPMYAEARSNTWRAESYSPIPLHEWGHTMGAVQSSAPNNGAGAHCHGKTMDVMCYTFGDVADCSEYRFDCGGLDYANALPEPGSYLATHWNVFANEAWASFSNPFLHFTYSPDVQSGPAGPDPDPDPQPAEPAPDPEPSPIGADPQPTPPAEHPGFADAAYHEHADAIRRLAGLGVIHGYPDGRFRPNQSITRAQAAAMFDRLLDHMEAAR